MRPTLCNVLLILSLALSAHSQKRPITETDLFDFHWIGDVQLAPDGKHVAFVQTQVKEDRSGYETSLYLLDLTTPDSAPQLLLAGTHDSSPRWASSGNRMLFLRALEVDGKAQPPQLYSMTLFPALSAPVAITTAKTMPKGVSQPAWGDNDSSWTVLSATLKIPAPVPPKPKPEHVSDIHIVTQNPWVSNGEGYIDRTMVPQLYRIAAVGAVPEQLTFGEYGVQEYVAVEGRSFLFIADHTPVPADEPTPRNQIYVLDAPGPVAAGHVVKLLKDLPFEARGLAASPHADGAYSFRVAFHAAPYPDPPAAPLSHIDTDLFALDVNLSALPDASVPVNLSKASGYEMGGGVAGDNTAPRGGGRAAITWSADGRQVFDIVGSRGSALLVSVAADGSGILPLTPPRQAVLTFGVSRDGQTKVALISNPIVIGDLFRITGPTSATQLTRVNEALFSQLNLQLPQNLQIKPTHNAKDIRGETIDSWVQLPPDFDRTRKYPAILNIHGGPHSAYGWVFDHEMLWMAAKGYVTIYPNPRGSTTYGNRFANVIENNYPGDDFHDLMDTVDAVVAEGWADPAKLGVTGGSGGGLLTDWTVTQDHRFKAAVAQRDIADAAAWWYTSDIGPFHQYWWPAAPFATKANLKLYHDYSPLTYVNDITTPMMFILGEADTRTPPSAGGEMLFRALTYRKIPAVMVRFPRENHELSRSGEPWHRVERLQNIVNWFDGYLLCKPEPQYGDKMVSACLDKR